MIFSYFLHPWGIVDIENEEHSDLKILRDCLMKTNMYNLIDTTNTIFYERYRRMRLQKRFENVEANVHAVAYSPGKMAALKDNNPLAYIHQETEDYRKNRDEMYHQEIEKEMNEKFKLYEEDLERKRQQIEKYRVEEENSLIEQYEMLQQRKEAFEAKKEQTEKKWKEKSLAQNNNSNSIHNNENKNNSMCLDDQNTSNKYLPVVGRRQVKNSNISSNNKAISPTPSVLGTTLSRNQPNQPKSSNQQQNIKNLKSNNINNHIGTTNKGQEFSRQPLDLNNNTTSYRRTTKLSEFQTLSLKLLYF